MLVSLLTLSHDTAEGCNFIIPLSFHKHMEVDITMLTIFSDGRFLPRKTYLSELCNLSQSCCLSWDYNSRYCLSRVQTAFILKEGKLPSDKSSHGWSNSQASEEIIFQLGMTKIK